MKAQIITIGDEILIGQITDTNSSWLAAELTLLGFSVDSMHSISDRLEAITQSVKNAMNEADLVIITGGLGPTNDDITKKTLCTIFNTELEFNPLIFSDVESFIVQRGSKMNDLNRDQALFPKSAKPLRNRQGTAPGIWFERAKKILISLPGVPWEMKSIFKEEAVPMLKNFFKLPAIYNQTVMITGMAESQLALRIENWEKQLPETVKLAYLPQPGIVRLRLGIKGENHEKLRKILNVEIEKLHKVIPENIFSDIEFKLEEIVGKLLKNSNKTLSTAESCTGGTIAKMITSIPGSSTYFKGSVVAYANEIKSGLLGVPVDMLEKHGAVSKEVVEQMALGARDRLNTDYSIATSGIAGPDGGTTDKPVGLVWIAVTGPQGVKSQQLLFGKERDINIKRSAIAALNMFRMYLNNQV